MSNQTIEIKQETVADYLLWGLWRCVTEDYKMKYPREIWEHFENAIRSASYTDSLKVFLTNFQKRIPASLEVQYMQPMLSVIESGNDEIVLNWLRTETTYLTILVRLKNQERKESLKLITG